MLGRDECYVLQRQIGQFAWKDDGSSSNLSAVKEIKRRMEKDEGGKWRIVLRTDIVIC